MPADDADAGNWFLEAGFGPIGPGVPPLFAGLPAARARIMRPPIAAA